MIQPDQSELTFYLNAYQDSHLIPDCLIQLKKVYPHSRLIIRADGDPDPQLPEIAQA